MAKMDRILTPENLLRVQGWARDGLTGDQIAENLGIALSTLHVWMHKKPELAEALKRGRDVADREVENALFKSALGYEYDEVTTITGPDGELVEHKVVTKRQPPSNTAQIFWLKNRRPDIWRDRKGVDVSGDMSVKNPFADLTTEELKKLAGSGPDDQ